VDADAKDNEKKNTAPRFARQCYSSCLPANLRKGVKLPLPNYAFLKRQTLFPCQRVTIEEGRRQRGRLVLNKGNHRTMLRTRSFSRGKIGERGLPRARLKPRRPSPFVGLRLAKVPWEEGGGGRGIRTLSPWAYGGNFQGRAVGRIETDIARELRDRET